MALDLNHFVAEGNKFMKDLSIELGMPDDRAKTGRILKSVLHTLRDQISTEESVQLIAQLPMFLKAVYVENWSLKHHQRIKHLDEFYEAVKGADGGAARQDFPLEDDVSSAITAVFICLRRYVSLGELEDIRAVLPTELKVLLNNPVIPS